jgi:hypothetical protein
MSSYTILTNVAHWYTPNSLATTCIPIECRFFWLLKKQMFIQSLDIWVSLKLHNHELDVGLVDLGHHDHLPT